MSLCRIASSIIDSQGWLLVALLWFDFALTFPTEVRRIWRYKFSGATVVYLFTRYTAIVDRVLFVTEVLLWSSSDQVSRLSAAALLRMGFIVFFRVTTRRVAESLARTT